MNKQKPVWRMNTGNGVPSDFAKPSKILVRKQRGVSVVIHVRDCNASLAWCSFYLDRPYISAYQTTRTKAAKHERMECGVCDGDGFYLGENSRVERTCKTCNGKGYRLEAIK